MVNYEHAKIYKIVCNTTGLQYIGSTCEPTLARRLVKHRSNYNDYKAGKRTYTTSFKILENGNYDIVLLETVKCNSKDELHLRERYYIENNECVNKCIPTRSKEEYYQIYKLCECGSNVSLNHRNRHLKTKKHLLYLEEN